MNSQLKIGIIGFGEVGRSLASGLAKGVAQLLVFDQKQPGDTAGFEYVPTCRELVSRSDIVLCCIWPAGAEDLAKEAAVYLQAGQVYMDLNNISPVTTKKIGKIISGTKGSFVKGAIMEPIAEMGAKAQILLGGEMAENLAYALKAAGLNTEFASLEAHVPAAVKILRSILLKGFIALAYETYWAAENFGAGREVLKSGFEALERNGVAQTLNNWMNSSLVHARRRAQELGESALTVQEAGFEPIMAAAAQRLFEEIDHKVVRRGGAPESYTDLLD